MCVVVGVAALGLTAAVADATPLGTSPPGRLLGTYSIPTEAGPENVVAGPDGNVWFTESWAGNVGMVTPDGTVSEYSTGVADSIPDGMTVGPDGNMWFADAGANAIGMVTPAGVVSEWSVPEADAWPTSIAAGPDGTLRFTESGNPGYSDSAAAAIGSFNPATDTFGTTVDTPTADSAPSSIVSDGHGDDYFVEFNPSTYVEQVAEIDSSGSISEIPLESGSSPDPTWNNGPGETAVSDGKLWFTDWGNESFGEMDLSTQDVSYTPFPPGTSGVAGLTIASDGSIWFTEASTGKVGQLDPSTGLVSEYQAGASGDWPEGIVQGPDGNIWFLDTVTNNIYKLSLASTSTTYSYTYNDTGQLTGVTDGGA